MIASMRCFTDSGGHPSGELLNASPQTGISRSPCDGTSRPSMMRATRSLGKTPPFLSVYVVRSGGACRRCSASGPSPRAVVPWHVAQYVLNSRVPSSLAAAGGACGVATYAAVFSIRSSTRGSDGSSTRKTGISSAGEIARPANIPAATVVRMTVPVMQSSFGPRNDISSVRALVACGSDKHLAGFWLAGGERFHAPWGIFGRDASRHPQLHAAG